MGRLSFRYGEIFESIYLPTYLAGWVDGWGAPFNSEIDLAMIPTAERDDSDLLLLTNLYITILDSLSMQIPRPYLNPSFK